MCRRLWELSLALPSVVMRLLRASSSSCSCDCSVIALVLVLATTTASWCGLSMRGVHIVVVYNSRASVGWRWLGGAHYASCVFGGTVACTGMLFSTPAGAAAPDIGGGLLAAGDTMVLHALFGVMDGAPRAALLLSLGAVAVSEVVQQGKMRAEQSNKQCRRYAEGLSLVGRFLRPHFGDGGARA